MKGIPILSMLNTQAGVRVTFHYARGKNKPLSLGFYPDKDLSKWRSPADGWLVGGQGECEEVQKGEWWELIGWEIERS